MSEQGKINIYNSLSRKKEPFEPLEKGKVKIYVCGPTVYDEPHIGHARSAFVFDVIRRYLEYKGNEVIFVRNVTDVDDKIINKAKGEFKDEDISIASKKVAEKYLNSYNQAMEKLGIKPPTHEPKATEYIAKMQVFIQDLINRNIAYQVGSDVYFDVKKAKNYGKLSHQNLEMMEKTARVVAGENKKDPLDFALWKSAKEGEPYWDSPWGKGRPGWHIECSVMSSDILGDEFDIHCGGIDLIFPHHENEVAQSEGAGKKFAHYWIHNGLLTINKEKMAKSLGNFVLIDDILKKHNPDELKMLYLQTKYSHPVDFSEDILREKAKSVERIAIFLKRIKDQEEGIASPGGTVLKKNYTQQLKEKIDTAISEFEEAMNDDFNTPVAVSVLLELVDTGNKVSHDVKYEEHKEKSLPILRKAKETIEKLGGILGLTFKSDVVLSQISEEEIKFKANLRNELRKDKKYADADRVRKELENQGIILEDSKDGTTTWRRKI